jgi:hypothetical protein
MPEKRSLLFHTKQKSFQKRGMCSRGGNVGGCIRGRITVGVEFRAKDGRSDETSIYIERDTLILLKCRRGTTDTV